MANVGIAGLNLHVFAYVTDVGFSNIVAATVLSIIASTQLGSTLVWGVISERMEIRRSSALMFLIQAIGLGTVLALNEIVPLYIGFLLYGVGLGGGWVFCRNWSGRATSAACRSAWCAAWVFWSLMPSAPPARHSLVSCTT